VKAAKLHERFDRAHYGSVEWWLLMLNVWAFHHPANQEYVATVKSRKAYMAAHPFSGDARDIEKDWRRGQWRVATGAIVALLVAAGPLYAVVYAAEALFKAIFYQVVQ